MNTERDSKVGKKERERQRGRKVEREIGNRENQRDVLHDDWRERRGLFMGNSKNWSRMVNRKVCC